MGKFAANPEFVGKIYGFPWFPYRFSYIFPVDLVTYPTRVKFRWPAGDPTNIGDAWARMPGLYPGLPNGMQPEK